MSLNVYLTTKKCPHCGHEDDVFSANITHNLGTMADHAGIYHALWRPDEPSDVPGATEARHLIGPLRTGLAALKADPAKFRAFDPPNGWGSYEDFVPWVERYLEACEANPDAVVTVSR